MLRIEPENSIIGIFWNFWTPLSRYSRTCCTYILCLLGKNIFSILSLCATASAKRGCAVRSFFLGPLVMWDRTCTWRTSLYFSSRPWTTSWAPLTSIKTLGWHSCSWYSLWRKLTKALLRTELLDLYIYTYIYI